MLDSFTFTDSRSLLVFADNYSVIDPSASPHTISSFLPSPPLIILTTCCDYVELTNIYPHRSSHPILMSTANGKVITSVSEATPADVDCAVSAAQKAFDTVWGLNAPGSYRAKLMHRLAELMEAKKEELAALEALDVGTLYFSSPVVLKKNRACVERTCG